MHPRGKASSPGNWRLWRCGKIARRRGECLRSLPHPFSSTYTLCARNVPSTTTSEQRVIAQLEVRPSRSQRCSTRREGVGPYRLLNWQAYFGKCCRTFAAIWRSVILSTVSTPTTRPLSPLLARRFSSSPLASPGPNIRMESASRIHAITAS